jgi:hypothetical protein
MYIFVVISTENILKRLQISIFIAGGNDPGRLLSVRLLARRLEISPRDTENRGLEPLTRVANKIK